MAEYRQNADWHEEDHPRDEDGKFADKGNTVSGHRENAIESESDSVVRKEIDRRAVRLSEALEDNEVTKGFKTLLSKQPDSIINKYLTAIENHPIKLVDGEQKSEYNNYSGIIALSHNSTIGAISHEYAHSFDEGAVNFQTTYYTITSASALIDYFTEIEQEKLNSDHTSGYYEISDYLNAEIGTEDAKLAYFKWAYKAAIEIGDIDAMRAVSDIVSSITFDGLNESSFFGGHEPDYWTSPYGGALGSNSGKEQWAQYCRLKIINNKKAFEKLKQICPSITNILERVWVEVFNK